MEYLNYARACGLLIIFNYMSGRVLMFDTSFVHCLVPKCQDAPARENDSLDESSSNPCNSDDSIVEKTVKKKLRFKLSPEQKRTAAEGDRGCYEIRWSQMAADGRTTLMMKNIPNKYSQTSLMRKIDEDFEGQYDFFYLPIDFKVRRVALILRRTNATSATPSSTWPASTQHKPSTASTTTTSGTSSTARRYAGSATHASRARRPSCATSPNPP